MMTTTRRRLEALEGMDGADRCTELPTIVPDDEIGGEAARRLRADGFVVLTFAQCAEVMV